ncbi:MAG: hypothetical protein ACI4VB_02150 [Bradymonadia bacterium]
MRLRNKMLALGCMAAASAMLVSGLACNEHEIAPFSKSLSAGKIQSTSSGSSRAVDILFVIDDSNSMAEEQKTLNDNFNRFLEQIIAANADFRMAVVSTDVLYGSIFQTGLNRDGQYDADKAECESLFANRKFISSSDEDIKNAATVAEKTAQLQKLFRCQSEVGTKGSPVERGLGTMVNAFRNKSINGEFKRKGSILSIVFVTDENDCSEIDCTGTPDGQSCQSPTIADTEVAKCEVQRNIEDSCIMTREDRIKKDSNNASYILNASGNQVTYNGVTKSMREWCVQGDADARNAILSAIDECVGDDESKRTDCMTNYQVSCPKGGCTNGLVSRSIFYNYIINDVVIASNRQYYEETSAELFADKSDAEKQALLEELAKKDVIVANIINRDRGVRYENGPTDKWCGNSGNESYRYQLFAEMFDNDPIYAPICCRKGEAFYTSISGSTEAVCADGIEDGTNSLFGSALGVIGRRIGEAVNTLCTDTAPLTCDPTECDNNAAACPCLYGCNSANPHFKGSDREYYLCNEFDLTVGYVPDSVPDEEISSEHPDYVKYDLGSGYTIDYESSYCFTRTGSPIQINLVTNEPSTKLVIQYPKRVSSI